MMTWCKSGAKTSSCVDVWVAGWMDGGKSRFKQSKIVENTASGFLSNGYTLLAISKYMGLDHRFQ